MRYSPASNEGTPFPGESTSRLPILKSIKTRNDDYDFSEDKTFTIKCPDRDFIPTV
jgi:hypothetical protein